MFEVKEKTMNIFVFKMKRSLTITVQKLCGYGRPFTTLAFRRKS